MAAIETKSMKCDESKALISVIDTNRHLLNLIENMSKLLNVSESGYISICLNRETCRYDICTLDGKIVCEYHNNHPGLTKIAKWTYHIDNKQIRICNECKHIIEKELPPQVLRTLHSKDCWLIDDVQRFSPITYPSREGDIYNSELQ